jgi:zinc protease
MSAHAARRAIVTVALAALIAAAVPAPRAHALEIKRMKLSNGAVLLVSEEHQLPMVTLRIAFDAGSRRDPKGKEGLAALTAQSLTQGTSKLTAAEFNQKVDFMGSSVSVAAGRDYAVASFTTLKKYEPDTLRLLAATLTEPGLRDADIERKRGEQVAALKAAEEQPGYTASLKFTGTLFGGGPYGHLPDGTPASVEKLTPDDVRNFYHQHYKLGSAVIAVAGDVKADEIKTQLEKDLGGLGGAVAAEPAAPAPTVAHGLHVDVIDRNVAQANVLLGFGGVARSNPDYYKLRVMNYIYGGGEFESRLMKVVRVKYGLAYAIQSGFEAGKFPGAFEVELQTKNASANEAVKLVLAQMREMQEKPVSKAELEGAKKYLIGSFPIKIDRQSSIASFMLELQLYNLGLDYADRYPKLIQAVTRQDVLEVARKYLHPDAVLLVAVANQREAKINTAALEAPLKEAASAKGGSGAAPRAARAN